MSDGSVPHYGAWFNIAIKEKILDDPVYQSFEGAFSRTRQSIGSKLDIDLMWSPYPGDFVTPAKTIGEGSYALIPRSAADDPTSWNGSERPTLDGVVDLITGAPLIQVTDLTLPFGGADFRLTRTRSANQRTHGTGATGVTLSSPSALYGYHQYFEEATSDWWDWNGIGWMTSENPFLLVDSTMPDAVGDAPPTCWFIPDAHHSIPFQRIESNGTYEAPPRFRARMKHNGTGWSTATRNWSTPPTQYQVILYEGEITYTFVVIREDIPNNTYDSSPALLASSGNPATHPDHCVDSSLHDRPYLPQYFSSQTGLDDKRLNWNPYVTRINPGLGIPYYGLCARIEDRNRHRVDIHYASVPTTVLDQPLPGNLDEYWESTRRKGQVVAVTLSAPDGAGGHTIEWTLLYMHRWFACAWPRLDRSYNGLDQTNPVAGMSHAAHVETSIDGDLVNGWSALQAKLSMFDETAFGVRYPEHLYPGIYASRGDSAIDRIYVYEGDPFTGSGQSIQDHVDDPLTITQLGTPDWDSDPLLQPLASPNREIRDDENQLYGADLPSASPEFIVRNFYEYEPGFTGPPSLYAGYSPSLIVDRYPATPLLVRTGVYSDDLGPAGSRAVSDRRIYHYNSNGTPHGSIITSTEDHYDIIDTTAAAVPLSVLPWLECVFESDDIARAIQSVENGGVSLFELTKWRQSETGDVISEAGDEDLSESLKAFATIRLNASPVDSMGEAVPVGEAWYVDPCDVGLEFTKHHKPEPYTLFTSGAIGSSSSHYLALNPQRIVIDESLSDSICGAGYDDQGPAKDVASSVNTASIRLGDGETSHYLLHKFLYLPTNDPAPPSVDRNTINNRVRAGAPRQSSIYVNPYKWFAYNVDHASNYHDGYFYYGNVTWALRFYEGVNLAGPGMLAAGDLMEPRWISMVDEFGSRCSMVAETGGVPHVSCDPGTAIEQSGEGSYNDDAFKTGMSSRRVFRINPAGHLLKERRWFYDADGNVSADTNGLGPEYLYSRVDDYLEHVESKPLPAPPAINPLLDDPLVPNSVEFPDPFEALRGEIILIEERSVGWSVTQQAGSTTTPEDDGLVSFYEYDIFGTDPGDPDVPQSNRVHMTATGIKSGVAYRESGGIFPNIAPGTRWYQRSYTRNEHDPSEIIEEVAYLTPSSSVDAHPVAPETATRNVKRYITEYATGQPNAPASESDRITAKKIIGAPRQIPDDSGTLVWLYPVEYETYDECGNSVWSCSGLVTDPENPDSGTAHPSQHLTATYYSRNSSGRSDHTVMDAGGGNTINIPEKPLDGLSDLSQPPSFNETLTLPGYPPEWSRVADGSPLNYTTSFFYDEDTRALSDIVYPNNRRWAMRYLEKVAPAPNEDQTYYEQYIFNDVIIEDGKTVSKSRGEFNDLPLGAGKFGEPMIRRNVVFRDNGSPVDIQLEDYRLIVGPAYEVLAKVELTPDANGRLSNARLLEPDAGGALKQVGTKEINDLGAIFREYDFDGTITRLTRSPIGQVLRTYVGTADVGWLTFDSEDPPDPTSTADFRQHNMVLLDRTEYGSGVNDAQKPTVTRTYRNVPGFNLDYHETPLPSTDTDSFATVTSYDWRGRPVREDTYETGVYEAGVSAPRRLMTTLTYLDFADRPTLVATYGADQFDGGGQAVASLSVPAADDPVSRTPGDSISSPIAASDVLGFGLRPLSVTETFYDNDGNAYESLSYDVSDSSGATYHSAFSYQGYSGKIVQRQSPGDGLRLTKLDGAGRISSELLCDPKDASFELARTDYTYDEDGNEVEVLRLVRTDDASSAGVLTHLGDTANAVGTRTVRWYDHLKRVVAEAELGTEAFAWTSIPSALVGNQFVRDAAPSYDKAAMAVSRAGLPDNARLWITAYNEAGDVDLMIDPAGVVTSYEYDRAGRLAIKTVNAHGDPDSMSLKTRYCYRYGRLVEMTVPRRGETANRSDLEQTYVHYGAPIVDDNFDIISEHNGLVGRLSIRDETHPDPDWDNCPVPFLPPGIYPAIDYTTEPGGVQTPYLPDEIRGVQDLSIGYTTEGRVAFRIDNRLNPGEYDSNGDLSNPGGDYTTGIGHKYVYDELGKLTQITVIHRLQNRVLEDGYPSGFITADSASSPEHIEFEYDHRHRLTRITSYSDHAGPSGIISQIERSYDDRDRMTAEWQALESVVDTAGDPAVAYEWSYLASSGQPGNATPGHDRLVAMVYDEGSYDDGDVDDADTRILLEYGVADSVNDLLSRIEAASVGIQGDPASYAEVVKFERSGDGSRLGMELAGGEIQQSFLANSAVLTGAFGLTSFGEAKDIHYKSFQGDTLFRSELTYDYRGSARSSEIDQVAVSGSSPSANQRSQVFSYDPLNRLIQNEMGSLIFETTPYPPQTPAGQVQFLLDPPSGPDTTSPTVASSQIFRSDLFTYDALGNRVGSENWADLDGDGFVQGSHPTGLDPDDYQAFVDLADAGDLSVDYNNSGEIERGKAKGSDEDLFITQASLGELPGRILTGNLDAHGMLDSQDLTAWGLSFSQDSDEDLEQTNHKVYPDNRLASVATRDASGTQQFTEFTVEHDNAGNLTGDDKYRYVYDAWNRLAQVWDANADPLVDDPIKEYTYDAMGRLVRTITHADHGRVYERYTYDGVRRIQDFIGTTISPTGPPSQLDLDREYVWSPSGGIDELLVQYTYDRFAYFSIYDAFGNQVALCDTYGGTGGDEARVVAQWNYDAFGEVITAEHLELFPVQRLGHKGLFLDRLDAQGDLVESGTGNLVELPRNIPFANVLVHNRNRTYNPIYGRFMQRDPNATALAVLQGSHSGRAMGSVNLTLNWETMYGDGMNLYQYMRSNPLTNRDPMGLSTDPFDIVDDYLAESAGSRAAFLSRIGRDAKAAAVLGATIASWLPVPGAGLVGDMALVALGEQGAGAAAAGIALGIVPGGKLAGKLGGFVARLGASAWSNATQYAKMGGGGFLRRVVSGVSGAVSSLATRAKRFVDDKPRDTCCFAVATMVWTASGQIPIDQIDEGTVVLTTNEHASEPSASTTGGVSEVSYYGKAWLVLLQVRHQDGYEETIRTTAEHPFHLTHEGCWTRVDQLQSGDLLSTIDGQATVLGISYPNERVPVYNLTIPSDSTYFVGDRGLWVHNCGGGFHHLIPVYMRGISRRAAGPGTYSLSSEMHSELHVMINKIGKGLYGIPAHSGRSISGPNGAAGVTKWAAEVGDPTAVEAMLSDTLIKAYEQFDTKHGTSLLRELLPLLQGGPIRP